MAVLEWDKTGERLYETGTKKGVLYPWDTEKGNYGTGVAWNGLTGVTESPSGADPTDLYADDIKYLTLRAAEEFGGTIEAYMYPDAWMECDGSAAPSKGLVIGQQGRKSFALSFVTTVGNDTQTNDYGEKIHLIYGATASPSERSYQSINDSPEAITFSWEFTTTAVAVEGYKPTSCLTIDTTKADSEKVEALKTILYGSESEEPRIPMPNEVIEMFNAGA